MPDNPTPDEYAELRAIFADALNPRRYGWKRSLLSQDTVEYIMQREDVLRAIKMVSQVAWQNVVPSDKELALKIRENALHSLATLAQAMRRVELDYL